MNAGLKDRLRSIRLMYERRYRRLMSVLATKYITNKLYKHVIGKDISWNNPVGIDEKLQCLKFGEYKDNDVVTQLVDKYRVRDYVAQPRFKGKIKTAKLYGVYKKADEIEWDKLPKQFVIKCNHGCGQNIVCTDKNQLDIESTKKQLTKWMKDDFWKEFCEIQYKHVDRRIIIEEFLGNRILTYKFFCFNGEPKVLYISSDGENGEHDKYIDHFDMNFKHLDIQRDGIELNPNVIEKPSSFEKMVEVSEELSRDFPFVRVDLYDVHGEVDLSEMTFIPTGGFMRFEPLTTHLEWGSWLKL